MLIQRTYALQLKLCSEQVQKLQEDRTQNTVILEHTQRKLLDVRKSSPQLRELLEESQSKLDKSRVTLAEMQIELEKERYMKIYTLFPSHFS